MSSGNVTIKGRDWCSVGLGNRNREGFSLARAVKLAANACQAVSAFVLSPAVAARQSK